MFLKHILFSVWLRWRCTNYSNDKLSWSFISEWYERWFRVIKPSGHTRFFSARVFMVVKSPSSRRNILSATLNTTAVASSLLCRSFICLQNVLFGEALNVASLDLYAHHIYPNRAFKISLMFTAAKLHLSLFTLLYIPEDIISSLIFYRRFNSLYIMDFWGGAYELFVPLLLLLIGDVLHNRQPKQQVKN